jgi:hypothetical protein
MLLGTDDRRTTAASGDSYLYHLGRELETK